MNSSDEASAGAAPGRPRVGRNAPCPCGSGKKYKRCCLMVRAGQDDHRCRWRGLTLRMGAELTAWVRRAGTAARLISLQTALIEDQGEEIARLRAELASIRSGGRSSA